MTAVQLFNEIKLQAFLLGGQILKQVIRHTLEAIASITIGRQKRKTQPRAVKRRPKPYPLLTVPRKQACELIN